MMTVRERKEPRAVRSGAKGLRCGVPPKVLPLHADTQTRKSAVQAHNEARVTRPDDAAEAATRVVNRVAAVRSLGLIIMPWKAEEAAEHAVRGVRARTAPVALSVGVVGRAAVIEGAGAARDHSLPRKRAANPTYLSKMVVGPLLLLLFFVSAGALHNPNAYCYFPEV